MSSSSLIDRIYDAAARDEIDEPTRRAYADSLGDDPRARFIRMQLDRVRDGARLDRAERDLLCANWRVWVGDPAKIVTPFGVEFARGFWDGCTYFDHTTPLDLAVVDAPTWSTVRRLHVNSFVPIDFARALIAGPVHRSLRTLRVETGDVAERIADWDGPFLALRELQLFYEQPNAIPIEYPGLPELLRLHVHVVGDGLDALRAIKALVSGPGTHAHVPELAFTVFDRGHRAPDITALIEHAMQCTRARTIELAVDTSARVVVERDGSAWSLRVVWRPAYGNHPASELDMRRLRDFARSLPAPAVVQLPDIETPPLDELLRDVTIERIPREPFPPAEISAVGAS